VGTAAVVTLTGSWLKFSDTSLFTACVNLHRGADKFLARPGMKQATATENFYFHISNLASKQIFSSSNKIHREVGRAKDLSAPIYYCIVQMLCYLFYILPFYVRG
jgi:hypothetical protein